MNIEGKKAYIQKQEVNIAVVLIFKNELSTLSAKTIGHIQKMYCAFGKERVFGRSDMQSVTQLGSTRASQLLKELVKANVIEFYRRAREGEIQIHKMSDDYL